MRENKLSIVGCRGNVFTELLSSNEMKDILY
jgi:hypothetical protein